MLQHELDSRGVATLCLDRPQLHNAFDDTLIAELNRVLTHYAADPSVRVLVLRSNGKSFSAGADLNWMQRAAGYTIEQNLDDARKLATMLRTLAELRKPTIARIHGAALGGGMGLAAACDICVASTAATFATSEVRFGLIPATIGPYVLRAIGARQASRYFLTAERIDARRAWELGLVHELVEPEALDARVQEVVSALLAGGPHAQAAAKDLIRAVADRAVDDALVEDTARRIVQIRATLEAKEGLSAFLEKRPPNWTVEP